MILHRPALATGLLSIAVFGSLSQASKPTPLPILKDFDDEGVLGGLYLPNTTGPTSRLAVYLMHAESDYTDFIACHELSKRGFTVFCANNDASKSGYMSDLAFEDMMTDVNMGMKFLRNLSTIDKVIILGHSGGGAMMTGYQNIAENGASACNGSEKIYPCSSAMDELEPADGLMLLDANYGLSTMAFLSLNPAMEDENDASKYNNSLSVFNTANGFRNNSQSEYNTEFKTRFEHGIVARNNRVLEHAQNRLKVIESGKGMFSDDEPLTIPAALYIQYNNLFFVQDTKYLHHTTQPWTLLRKNGTVNRVIESVRVPASFVDYHDNWENGALKTSIRRYLSTLAIRVKNLKITADNLFGIDHHSSQTAPLGNIQGIKVPLLNMGMTGHYEFLWAEKLHLKATSNDTAIAFVEGAQHGIITCTECESYPGEFGDTATTCFDYVAGWLTKKGRFL